jgi:purine-nucleoside phosphorylase
MLRRNNAARLQETVKGVEMETAALYTLAAQ